MPSPRTAALCLLAGIALGACGDDDGADVAGQRADQARQAALDAGLDEDVADFLGLLGRGDTATYAVRFPGPADGTELVVRRRPPDRRVDLEADGELVEVRQVVDGEAFTCTPGEDGDGWSCERTDALVEGPGVFTAGALERLSERLAEGRADYDFVLERRDVAGVEASCLTTRLRDGQASPELGEEGTICASREGVVLLVDQGSDRIEALDYTTDVDADAFDRLDAGGG
ncbi:MAG: hypothetical protein ACLGIC_08905 [Acidimicrobiia bacterium]